LTRAERANYVRLVFPRCLVLVLLGSAAAVPAARALDFTPCTETGHEAFECATLAVPIDRSGMVPGMIALSIERPPSPDPSRPVLIALAGGPGQSATAFVSAFASVLAPALDRYQLVVFDQRGTGRSNALDCPALRATYSDETIMACGVGLGAAARFHTTADSVLDLDDVRAALGVDQMVITGVSYGTHVALEYARTFPDHTAALVLDSTVPSSNISAFVVESFAAIPRVLRDLCSRHGCDGITGDPLGDTAALVQRLAQPLEGTVIDAEGHAQRRAMDAVGLFAILVAGDLLPVLHARYPGAVVAAERGDATPLLRLGELVGVAGIGLGRDVDPAVRADSLALLLATACADIEFPWQETDSPTVRSAALHIAVAALPADRLFPFERATASQSGAAGSCIHWPVTGLDRARSTEPVPDVPTLILAGTRDVRTPLENADEVGALLPRSMRVVVQSRGHSLLTAAQCARDATATFLHDFAALIGDPCAAVTPAYDTEPLPAQKLRDVVPRGIRGIRGRVLSVVIDSLNDAIKTAVTVYQGPGQPVAFGGLRAGRAAGTLDAQSFHLSLTRYTLVKGVAVKGSIDFDGQHTIAHAKVRGRMTGKLAFRSDGSIRGHLGGRRIALVKRERWLGGTPLVRPAVEMLRPIP
jgi:pimeloyl-ACP methyl ester carboxylesterase